MSNSIREASTQNMSGLVRKWVQLKERHILARVENRIGPAELLYIQVELAIYLKSTSLHYS